MEFRRITSLPPYVFTIIDGLKVEARRAGDDVIDLGFGNPDLPSPRLAVDKLCEAAHNPRNHRYSASRGIPKLRQAVADLLPAALRRRPRPRHRGHQHHRGQGGLLPPDVGAAPARRRRPGAVAVLPDPHLGAAVRRRRHPRVPRRHRRGLLREPQQAFEYSLAQAPGDRAVVPPQPHHHLRRPRLHAEGRRLRPRERGRRSSTTTPTPSSASTATARRRSSRPRGQGVRRRALLDDQVLLDGRVAHGVPGRQRRGRAGAGQAQVATSTTAPSSPSRSPPR